MGSWKGKFVTIFTGQLFSILTSSMVQFAIIWHLTASTGSAIVLMLAGLAGFLPQAILGPFIGVWLDRWNRKKTMIIADGAIAFFSLLLGLYYFLGNPSLAVVYVILAIRSTASSFHAPAFQAAVPLIAPQEELTRVAGWQQMVFSVSTVFGPALGIAVLEASSLAFVLFLDVLGALIANTTLAFVKIDQPKADLTEKPSFVHEFRIGWNSFVQEKPIVLISIGAAVFGIAFMPLATLFPLMTYSHFERGGFSASLIEAVFSVGMIVGGVLLGVIGSKWKDATYMFWSLVVIGLTCVFSGILSKEVFFLFVVLSFLMGFAAPFLNGPYMAMIQKAYAPEKLGRVISIITSIQLLSSPIGLAMAGPVVERWGVTTWFFWGGVVTILTGIVVFLIYRQMDTKGLEVHNEKG